MKQIPVALWVWLAAIILFPLAAATNFGVAYGLYAAFIAVAAARAIITGNTVLAPSYPMIWKWVALFAVTGAHFFADGQVVNTISLLVADLGILLVIRPYDWDPATKKVFFRVLLATLALSAILGLIIGILFWAQLGFPNPIYDLTHGGRLRIYSARLAGHSPLADFAFVAGLLAASNVIGFKFITRAVIYVGSLLLLFLSNSATSILLIGTLLAVPALEAIPGRAVKNVAYFIGAIVLILALLNPQAINEILAFIRFTVLHRETATYGSDLTAGRGVLNTLLLDTFRTSPVFGVGHDDPVIKYGAQVLLGRQTNIGVHESPFRILAEYGVLFTLCVWIFVLAPLTAVKSRDRSVRTFAITLAVGVVCWMTSNTLFGIAHNPAYFLYTSLLLIAASPSFQGSKFALRNVNAEGARLASSALRRYPQTVR